jgi:hypothetical protein
VVGCLQPQQKQTKTMQKPIKPSTFSPNGVNMAIVFMAITMAIIFGVWPS